MGRIEDNKQKKKERLMATAYELYTSKGIARTSISDIVNNAGMAKGTFYLYFHDKYDLQEKLVAHKAEQLFQHAIKESGFRQFDTPADKVIALVDDIYDQLNHNKHILRFINKNLSWGIFRKAIDRSQVNFISVLLEVFPKDIEVKKLEILLFTIVELVGSTIYSVILENDPVSPDEYRPYLNQSIRAVIDTFLQSNLAESVHITWL